MDKGISIAAAIVALLLGYRFVGKKPGESEAFDKWHARWGRTVRIRGWVMLACFVPLLIVDLARVLKR